MYQISSPTPKTQRIFSLGCGVLNITRARPSPGKRKKGFHSFPDKGRIWDDGRIQHFFSQLGLPVLSYLRRPAGGMFHLKFLVDLTNVEKANIQGKRVI
ncbi:hypothetical protein CDAR_484881 [Caerostris darwini]|uniref:Uncharacterized protein n=1 Tax=Caerostris darwini TaxID=1538125 RepID=A0AAV4PDR4_9ARAC|nr:hypothetical protein CDAR_484881 [Caerostris darwini]